MVCKCSFCFMTPDLEAQRDVFSSKSLNISRRRDFSILPYSTLFFCLWPFQKGSANSKIIEKEVLSWDQGLMTLSFHMPRASLSPALNTSGDGAPTGALGNLCQRLATLRGKKIFSVRAVYLCCSYWEDCALLWVLFFLFNDHWYCWEICFPLISND